MNRRKRQAVCFAVVNTVTVIIITIIIVKSRKVHHKNQVTQPTEYFRGVDKVASSFFKISKATRRNISTTSSKHIKIYITNSRNIINSRTGTKYNTAA